MLLSLSTFFLKIIFSYVIFQFFSPTRTGFCYTNCIHIIVFYYNVRFYVRQYLLDSIISRSEIGSRDRGKAIVALFLSTVYLSQYQISILPNWLLKNERQNFCLPQNTITLVIHCCFLFSPPVPGHLLLFPIYTMLHLQNFLILAALSQLYSFLVHISIKHICFLPVVELTGTFYNWHDIGIRIFSEISSCTTLPLILYHLAGWLYQPLKFSL